MYVTSIDERLFDERMSRGRVLQARGSRRRSESSPQAAGLFERVERISICDRKSDEASR